MDRVQQGVSLPRFDQPRMQYHHGGGHTRMPPFPRGGGGAYRGGQKQFYPPPPPPPLPAGPSPQNKYEVLMEAGRLAAEYLVEKGMLPPASLQRRSGGVGSMGWGQPQPPPALSPAQEAPAFYGARNGRQRLDDEYGNPNPRFRRNPGGDYNNSNTSSSYNGRGKRKFGAYNRNSDWGRDRERSGGYSDGRSYDEEEEDGTPGYRREQRGSGGIDEAASSVSGVAGAGPKVDAMEESELEDTGSRVSSISNVKKDADAVQEVEDENEADKMQEDSKVSNSEVVEQGMNGESNSNNVSGVLEEIGVNHLSVPTDDCVSDQKPDVSTVLDDKTTDDKAEDDKVSEEKVSSMENNLGDDCKNLLKYCSFGKAPTRPRSILAHRNGAPAHKEIAVAEQADLVAHMAVDEVANASSFANIQCDNSDDLVCVGHTEPSTACSQQIDVVAQMVVDEAENDSSLTNIQGDKRDDPICLENTEPSTACNEMVEQVRLQEKEAKTETEDTREQNIVAMRYAVQKTEERDGPPEDEGLIDSHRNSLNLQFREGIPVYNIDTPPEDEGLIDSANKGKSVMEVLPIIKAETVVTMEEENLGESSSFKICDLNLVGSPEVAEIRIRPSLRQCSTAMFSEAEHQQQVDFGTTVGNNASSTSTYNQILLDDKVVQVIDIEDDPPIEPSACDTSKVKSEMEYSSMENMMNPTVNNDALPGIQDGYNLAITDFLGSGMPCYQPIQTDLHANMGLNDSEVITVMDDPIYGSLSDIGFMGVWDQQPPDYEKFF